MRGSVHRAKLKGIITIAGVATFFNVWNDGGVFDLHASEPSECQKSLSERFLCMGSVQRAKFKGIIAITGVAVLFNV